MNQIETLIPDMHKLPGVDALDQDIVLYDEKATLPDLSYPYRIDAALLVICQEGESDVNLNMRPHHLSRGDMLILLPGAIVQYHNDGRPRRYIMLGLSSDFVRRIEVDSHKRMDLFFHIQSSPVTRLTDEEMQLFEEYHTFIRHRLRQSGPAFRKDISLHLLYAWFHEVLDVLSRHTLPSGGKPHRREELFEQFMRLVVEHFRRQRFIPFYADRLCITPKYLSSVVRSVSGHTPTEWINNHLVTEARALLRSTSLSVQEVSERLNFPNQSFFGRFFKHHVGLSPREFREKGE